MAGVTVTIKGQKALEAALRRPRQSGALEAFEPSHCAAVAFCPMLGLRLL
jgi:hypothetical protein